MEWNARRSKYPFILSPLSVILYLMMPAVVRDAPRKPGWQHSWESHFRKYFVLARKRMGLVMTTQQIGSLYPRQLLQGSVNARPASFCQVFCDEKKFGHKKLSNVAQSSRPRTRPHLPCPCGPQGETEALTKCQYMPSILWLEFQLLKLMRMTCKPVLLTVGWLAQM